MALIFPPNPALQADEEPQAIMRAMPDGVPGIAATLDEMARLARIYKSDLGIRHQAEAIISAVASRNFFGEVQAVRDWVFNNIRYTMDIDGVETIKTPLELLKNRFGDCDDMTTLAGALLASIGYQVRFVAVGPDSPDNFEHVLLEAKFGRDRWFPVELTENVSVGWSPPEAVARMVRRV